MKKIFSVILAAVMLLSAAPLGGFVGLDLFGTTASAASYNGTCGTNLTWTFDSETDELVISGEGDMDGYSSSASVPWNSYRTQIKSVTIGDGVTSIGKYAFYYCENMTSVTIPDSVTSIGNYAFYNCRSLISVTIPDGVTSIGGYAFFGCSNLTSVSIPDSVTSLGVKAFSSCTSLTSVTIPESVTSIGGKAFNYCTMLRDVYYTGSQEQWNNIEIGSDNSYLTNATIHYNYVPCDHPSIVTVETLVATCTEDGHEEGFMCNICGEALSGLAKINKLGHDWIAGTPVPATCTTDGYIPYSCSRCAETREDIIYATGHFFGEWVITKDPTCTDYGIKERACTMCGDSISYTIPTIEHSYVTTVVAPTCTMIGYTEHKCSVCESYFNTDIKPATGHDMGEWVVLQKGSCTMFELRGRTCLICKTKEFDYIEAPGHDYENTSIYPTCTEDGYIAHVCSLCGDSYNDSEKPAIGHDFGRWVVLQNGSCTEDEIRERTCSRCKSKETKVIAATDHDYKETETAATCTEEGKTTFTCSKCNDSYETDFVEPLGHLNFEDREVPATCTESGLTKGRHCARCNEVFAEQEVIPATGHRDGNNDGYCDSCNFETDKVLHCSCRCHKTDFFSKIIWFFEKLFGAKNRPCECGASHR